LDRIRWSMLQTVWTINGSPSLCTRRLVAFVSGRYRLT
jgi:hypothetical protein